MIELENEDGEYIEYGIQDRKTACGITLRKFKKYVLPLEEILFWKMELYAQLVILVWEWILRMALRIKELKRIIFKKESDIQTDNEDNVYEKKKKKNCW